jgi:hypothetical protein
MPENDINSQQGWSFRQEEPDAQDFSQQSESAQTVEPIVWTGSEFIAQQKDGGWYMGLFFAILACCVVAFLVTGGDYLSVGFIAIIGILFGIIAGRSPRQLRYQIDNHGITIGNKLYPFTLFKSFAVMQEGAIGYVNLFPLHRFKPEISIYFAPDDADKILNALSNYLPNEQRPEHKVDRLMKHIRF